MMTLLLLLLLCFLSYCLTYVLKGIERKNEQSTCWRELKGTNVLPARPCCCCCSFLLPPPSLIIIINGVISFHRLRASEVKEGRRRRQNGRRRKRAESKQASKQATTQSERAKETFSPLACSAARTAAIAQITCSLQLPTNVQYTTSQYSTVPYSTHICA